MLNGIIYCAISPSNKKYYGYTLNLNERKRWHYRDAFKRNKSQYFCRALRKYGFENFIWNIIETYQQENKIELHDILCEREIFWIEKDKTYIPEYGYNMTKGGDGCSWCNKGKKITQEHKDKLKIPCSEERKTKIKLARKILEKNPEYKQKQRDSRLGEKNHMFGKTVYEIWVGKYGEEVANEKVLITNNKKSINGKKSHNLKEYVCPFCNTTGKGPNMKRYHFDKCKEKK